MSSPSGIKKILLPQRSKEMILAQVEGMCDISESGDLASIGDIQRRMRSYFTGEPVDFPDRLDFDGATLFQQSVWQTVQAIPYGETRSYAWVSRQSGYVGAARAVGQALKKNPFPIVVPCHRVIGSDGDLGGFSGGVGMKEILLRLELREEHLVIA